MVMTEIAKMRVAERRGEAGNGGRPGGQARLRSGLGWKLVGAGLRLGDSRALVRRIEGGA
ncbi:MAG TPA: hypothetical protein VGR41_08740 [Actinomycetota bacterium]|nr:hypothetical protein [Actinomycetota bacterium]